MACVTEENLNSIRFHEKFGYQKVGVLHKTGFKFNRWLDVTWMEKTLNKREKEMAPIIPWKELD